MPNLIASLFVYSSLAAALASPAQAGEVPFGAQGHAYNPVWSADGRTLAFEVNTYGSQGVDLYFSKITGVMGSQAKKINLPGASGPYGGTQVVANPAWHPSGIAVFEGSNQGGTYRLYFAQPGGAAAAEMLPSSLVSGNLSFPAVSADGRLLAFISDQSGDGDVRSWNRSTNQVTQLTNTVTGEMFPQFRADGSKLLFTRKVNQAEDIFQYDFATASERSLVSGPGDQTRPIYTPSGSHVVYFTVGLTEGEWDIGVVNADGSNKNTLARGIRLPLRARPALSTDGKWVAYVYDDPTKGDSVHLTRIDGMRTIEIKTPHKACGEPSIGQQGDKILLAYTALPAAEADWRALHLIDITNKL